jgi:hypothetical protein
LVDVGRFSAKCVRFVFFMLTPLFSRTCGPRNWGKTRFLDSFFPKGSTCSARVPGNRCIDQERWVDLIE